MGLGKVVEDQAKVRDDQDNASRSTALTIRVLTNRPRLVE
jgi:hypothetical protein